MTNKINSWNQVIGSKDQIKIVLNAIKRDVLPHFLLYTGASGIGKSTVAHLTAKSLLCEASNQNTGEPCYKCPSCIAMDKGIHQGYKKINMPELCKKEDVNEQIKNIFKFQKLANKTVFVLEEIHDLREELQRPLLEPLTDIPADVYIISCTTKPYKLIPELSNRAFRVELTNPSKSECISYVSTVANSFNIQLPSIEAVERFAELSEYNPRIISETLRVIATDNELSEESLSAMFHIVSDEEVIEFVKSFVLSNSVVDIITTLKRVENRSLSRLVSRATDIIFNALLYQNTKVPIDTYNEKIDNLIYGELSSVSQGTLAQCMASLGLADIRDKDSFAKNLSKITESKLKVMKISEKSLTGISSNTVVKRPAVTSNFTAFKDGEKADKLTSEFSNSEIISSVQIEKLMLDI